MANQEQLEILKQGVEVWNKWREDNFDIEIDLTRANLALAKLEKADLTIADLSEANLTEANLVYADLSGSDLSDANLTNAELVDGVLVRAVLPRAVLVGADLTRANLTNASVRNANFTSACLGDATLREVDFKEANLEGANLSGADLTGSFMERTILGDNDLSSCLGLETIWHFMPSTIGTDTIRLSKGKIPVEFLRGCGLSDVDIEYAKLSNPDLSNEEINKILYGMYDLRATQALQISPLFISYSHADSAFVDKLESQLNAKGIRFWRDIHEMKAGRVETQIDRAINLKPTVLLILSQYSLGSDWVEHEVRTARELEKELGRDTLCPIALDDSWKASPWPKRVMEQVMEYNILDFSEWEDDSKFEGMFRRLIDGLELFYKG